MSETGFIYNFIYKFYKLIKLMSPEKGNRKSRPIVEQDSSSNLIQQNHRLRQNNAPPSRDALPPSELELQEMNPEEFNMFIAKQNVDYAREIARNFRRPIEQVRVEAEAQLKQLLPDGIKTKGHTLLKVVETRSSNAVGAIWFKLESEADRAFLYYIEIHEPYRGKGYGKIAMNLLEDLLREKNVKSLGLHVFADNQVALNLYKRQGFSTGSYNMEKIL